MFKIIGEEEVDWEDEEERYAKGRAFPLLLTMNLKSGVRGFGFTLVSLFAAIFVQADSFPPIPAGSHVVGTTRFVLAEAFSQVGDSTIERWMIGEAGDDAYIRGRLDPSVDFGVVTIQVPNDPSLYGPRSGRSFEAVYFVSYPTDPGNPRPDYAFPYSRTDSVFERMQGAGEEPIFADPSANYPLVLVSHGIRSHSIWDLGVTKSYARHGYISAAIFYGDGRFPNENNSFYNGALRPLISKQVLDDLLASSFGDHIDKDRIGMVGNSFGGMTTIALMGGRIANHPSSQRDPRIHAGVGVVPWVGSGSFYPFGSGNLSVGAVDKPFMTIYGTRDFIAKRWV